MAAAAALRRHAPPLPRAAALLSACRCCLAVLPLVPQPITMMRNALGREEGGSGVPLDKDKYEAATAYWQAHAAIQ